MRPIDIDFDVFKALTAALQSETDTYNEVVRRLLKLPSAGRAENGGAPEANPAGRPWVSKGLMFEHGTEFRASYKGQLFTARADDGRLIVEGKGASSSLSHAARLITNNSVDGWTFWEVKRPRDRAWRRAGELRTVR